MIGRWLCRRGWHRYVFVSMKNRRTIDAGFGHIWQVCHLTEKCSRGCGLIRTRPNGDVPRRPKVEAA